LNGQVNVQMAAAVAAFDIDPETARRSLVEARASSKAALQELRATVVVLHDGGQLAPAPRLDQLEDLAGPARAAGIEVTIADDRHDAQITGAVELAAYRVVQEALTNIVRHSGARRAAVSLRQEQDDLVIEVTDDGTAPPASTNGGYGLRGMAERVRAVGGRLDYGPSPSRGFHVRAHLPTNSRTR